MGEVILRGYIDRKPLAFIGVEGNLGDVGSKVKNECM